MLQPVCMCRQEQQQQTQSMHQRQRSLVQLLLTGGVRGGSAAGSSRVETAQGSSFVKKWPNMSAADIEAAQVAIALAFYTGNLPHSLIEVPEFKAMILTLAPWMEGHVPTRKMLSGSLLDKVYGAEVERVRSWLEQQVCLATVGGCAPLGSTASNMQCLGGCLTAAACCLLLLLVCAGLCCYLDRCLVQLPQQQHSRAQRQCDGQRHQRVLGHDLHRSRQPHWRVHR